MMWIFDQESNPSVIRTKGWLLMDSTWLVFAIAAMYLLLVKIILPKIMEHRKPYNLKVIIQSYNVFQVVVCSYIVVKFIENDFDHTYFLGCVPPAFNTAKGLGLAKAIHLTYLIKFVEFIETVFFILRKKQNQVSTLHTYHHCSTFVLAYFYAKYVGGSGVVFSLFLNNIVHVVMYTYYFLSSLGVKSLNEALYPFKKFITKFQITQFVLILTNCSVAIARGCMTPTCRVFLMFYMTDIVILLYLFYQFYTQSYKNRKVTTNGGAAKVASGGSTTTGNDKIVSNGVHCDETEQTKKPIKLN